MGVFGQVEIIIECESDEVADQIADNLEAKVTKYVEENSEYEGFHLAFDDVDGGDTCVIVNISSGRVQNAEWQGTMVKEFLLANHKEDVISIRGEVTTPESYLYWDKEQND
jgi:hypothetical protein